MSLAATRHLIALGAPALPERHYLHVFEGGPDAADSHDWLPDRTRALRFASAADAQAFGDSSLTVPFTVTEHPAADLVGSDVEEPEDEVDDLAAC